MVLSFHAADTGNVPATDASMTACSPAKTSRDRTKARILDLEKKLETSPMMAPSRMTAHIVVKRGKGGAASDTVVATLEQLRETFTAIGARASQ